MCFDNVMFSMKNGTIGTLLLLARPTSRLTSSDWFEAWERISSSAWLRSMASTIAVAQSLPPRMSCGAIQHVMPFACRWSRTPSAVA